MTFTNRSNAERHAQECALVSGDAWLVVDTSSDLAKAEYRVWRESTLQNDEVKHPETIPFYELISRVENGKVDQIA